MQRKHNYSKRKKRPNLPFGKNLLHVASAGVGSFALLVVVFFFFLRYDIFLCIIFFGIYLMRFFWALKRYLFLCISYSTLTFGRTRGDKRGWMPPPIGFSAFSPRG